MEPEPQLGGQGRGHYVYLARCANGAVYTGYAVDVARRIEAHNSGKGARYTRSNRPVTLLAAWSFESRSDALKAERAVKRLPPAGKLALDQRAPLWPQLDSAVTP